MTRMQVWYGVVWLVFTTSQPMKPLHAWYLLVGFVFGSIVFFGRGV